VIEQAGLLELPGMSLLRRSGGLVLPDNETVGHQFGESTSKTQAKMDHDQLLYAIRWTGRVRKVWD